MARYGREYGRNRGAWGEGGRGRGPGWVETFRQGWGFGAAASEDYGAGYRGYDTPYGGMSRGGRSRFGSGYGGAERGEGWSGPDRGYDRGYGAGAGWRGSTAWGGSTARGGRGDYGSRYGSGNRTGYNRYGGGGRGHGYDQGW